jgi:prophage regulatory protein
MVAVFATQVTCGGLLECQYARMIGSASMDRRAYPVLTAPATKGNGIQAGRQPGVARQGVGPFGRVARYATISRVDRRAYAQARLVVQSSTDTLGRGVTPAPIRYPLARTLMRPREVCAATGLSRSGVYRLIREGRFPKPVPLTRHVSAFPSTEIQAWIDARIAERDATLGSAP